MTASTDDPFGTLRSLLQSPPSRESWAAIWELLMKLVGREPHELERALVYASSLLERWPDALRSYARALLWSQPDSQAARLLPLCRTLDLSNIRSSLAYFTRPRTTQITDVAFSFERMTRLDLSASEEPFSDIATLMEMGKMRALRSIDLSKSKQRRSDSTYAERLRAFAEAIAKLDAPAALDLTKVAWADADSLRLLLTHGGSRIASLNLSQSKQNGHTLSALRHAVGGSLRGLNLSRNRAWQHHGIEALSRSGVLDQLEHLDLSRNDLREPHLSSILGALSPRARSLGLTEVQRPDLLRLQLEKIGALPSLHTLALDTQALPWSLDSPSLTRLELCPNGAIDHDLSAHPAFANLTHLRLHRGHDEASVEAILSRANLSRLHTLDLDDVATTDDALIALAANPTASLIERVRIASPSMSKTSRAGFVSLLELESLHTLEIERVSYSSDNLDDLFTSPRLSTLQTLSLLDCALSDSTTAALFHNPALHQLEVLRFRQTSKLSKPSIDLLVDPPHVPRHWRPSKHILELRAARAHLAQQERQKHEKS